MLSVYVVCWIFLQTFQTYFCIQANNVDLDQTAPKGAVWSGSTLFAKMTFKITSKWQSTTIVVIGVLRVNRSYLINGLQFWLKLKLLTVWTQNIRPDLDPICLTMMVFLKDILKKFILKKIYRQ